MIDFYNQELEKLKEDNCFRSIADVRREGKYIYLRDGNTEKKLLNMSSNDYLGINSDVEISRQFVSTYKGALGSGSARLLTGNTTCYVELESLLAKLFNKERALLFNSGYHTNVGVFQALLTKKSVVFSDKLNHASIIDGLRLSGGDFFRYKHLDYENLEALIQKHAHNYENIIIASESVFSMDGDIADIKKLVEIKQKYNAVLVIDEAHAFGIFGRNGLGVAEEVGCLDDIDLLVAMFGKSIGSYGGFVVGNEILISYLINKARPFIFSTLLPEISVEFSKFVLETILPFTYAKRLLLLDNAQRLREKLRTINIKTAGESQIVPVILGENQKAVDISEKLIDCGYYLLPIRHPTVPKGTARLRISLSANIDFCELEQFFDIFSHIN